MRDSSVTNRMWQTQGRIGERGKRRKGLILQKAAWACGEELYDCHLTIDGALSEHIMKRAEYVCLRLWDLGAARRNGSFYFIGKTVLQDWHFFKKCA